MIKKYKVHEVAKDFNNEFDLMSAANIAGFIKVCDAMLAEGVF